MKKKPQKMVRYFKMPHLYRDDIEKIENIIREELKPKEYKLETNEFEYNKLKEIPETTKPTSSFHLQTYDPYISIDFSSHSASMYGSENDLKIVGAFRKIEEVLIKTERKKTWFVSYNIFWVGPLILFPSLLLSIIQKIEMKTFFVLLLISVLIGIVWILIGIKSSKNFSLIEFSYKKKEQNFYKRNKDQIILITFGAFLGSILTIFFQKIF